MSKAHKVLGSAPLSIDVAGGWQRAPSSPISDDDASASIAATHAKPGLRTHDCKSPEAFASHQERWRESVNGGAYRYDESAKEKSLILDNSIVVQQTETRPVPADLLICYGSRPTSSRAFGSIFGSTRRFRK
ncbi:hypothetical protein UVI_02023380 [Ustilaginoidea virens]|uniref:Uncharacterized protein n=1 Tax=Ustilaginoidea virens TaxID=1159556 RepID=A0A1B5L727_USTVR|nr:hypothetical protein UVI_02023380 [Ustilaginoidea virens]